MKELSSQELRIGNYVEYGGCTAKVCQIEKSFFYCETDGNDFFTRDGEPGAKPIPITEEWLLKFGFVYDGASGYNKAYVHLEKIVFIGYVFFIKDVVSGPSIDVEYVHQLQNLYFALTGEELTLEP